MCIRIIERTDRDDKDQGLGGNMQPSFIESLSRLPDLKAWTGLSSQVLCGLSIAFNPIYWNMIAQLEYRTHFGKKYIGARPACYLLALSIFFLGLLRDGLFLDALKESHASSSIEFPVIGTLFFCLGNVLVLSSMWQLGITGTYLGDYFGILMDHRVTGFPFNVTNNPMYYGSTLSFLGTSLYYGSWIGLVFTMEVLLMYLVALTFEEPYTAAIYAKREAKKGKSP